MLASSLTFRKVLASSLRFAAPRRLLLLLPPSISLMFFLLFSYTTLALSSSLLSHIHPPVVLLHVRAKDNIKFPSHPISRFIPLLSNSGSLLPIDEIGTIWIDEFHCSRGISNGCSLWVSNIVNKNVISHQIFRNKTASLKVGFLSLASFELCCENPITFVFFKEMNFLVCLIFPYLQFRWV